MIGIVLSVTLLTSIGTIATSYKDKLIRQTMQSYGDYHVSFNGIPGEAVSKVSNYATVGSAGIISREGYAVISETDEKEKKENPVTAPFRYLNVKRYDANAMNMLQVRLESGRLPENANEIILSSWGLNLFPNKPKLGDHIKLNLGVRTVASTGKEKAINGMGDFGWDLDEAFQARTQKEFKVVGIMKPPSNSAWSSAFIIPAITFNDNKAIDPDRPYFIYAKMKSMDQIKKKTESIVSSLKINDTDQGSALQLNRDNSIKNVRIEFNNELLKLYGKSTYDGVNKSSILALAAIIAIILICTFAVIYNAFHISVLERIAQFGILRCIGATPSQIRNIVLKEAAILSLVSIPIGLFTGTLFMKILFYSISFISLGFLNDMKMVVSIPILAFAGLLGLLTVYISAIGPAKQAARVSPLEAVKSSGNTNAEKITRIKKSAFMKKLLGLEGQFARRNLQRNKRRFRITAFSMIISVILFIVFSGIVDFLKQTSSSGMHYSYSINYEGPSKRIPDSVYQDVLKLEAVQKAYKFYNHQVEAIIPKNKINPNYYEVMKSMYSVDVGEGYRTGNNYLNSLGDNGLDDLKSKLIEGTIDREKMNRENGVIVLQKIAMITEKGKKLIIDQTNFKVGDQIQIRSPEEGKKEYTTVTVVGVADQELLSSGYSESHTVGFITTPKVIAKITGNDAFSRILIIANPDAPNAPITDYLQALIKQDAGYSYMDKVAESEQAKNDEMTSRILLYGFIGVIDLIAFINILNTVSTNLILRTKEFAVLKAIGMTQKQLNKMILLEGALLGVFAALNGILIGVALDFSIQRLFSDVVEMAWTIPWRNMGIAFAGAMITILVATIWPMRTLKKVNIVDALRRG
ncbi:ABC transporter permease [Cohnella faecalis]|nr:ABC transporter permease [Cohnella faecalis]